MSEKRKGRYGLLILNNSYDPMTTGLGKSPSGRLDVLLHEPALDPSGEEDDDPLLLLKEILRGARQL